MKLKLFTKLAAAAMAMTAALFANEADAQTFTAIPAEGSNISSGGTITLTFEDVTKVTEDYSKLCTCTQNGSGYRVRTNTDRNKFEITLVNDPRPGEFQITIASGYLLLDGVPYEQTIVLNYNFKAAAWTGEVRVTPDINLSKGYVEELGDVTYQFLGAKRLTYLAAADKLATLTRDGVLIKSYKAADVRCMFDEMTFFNEPAYTEPGYYILSLPAEAYTVDNETGMESWVYGFRIAEEAITYDPADTSLSELDKITVTFDNASTVTEVTPLDQAMTVADENGDAIDFTASVEGNKVTVLLSEVIKNGQCVITIPAGTLALDGVTYNKVVTRTYTVESVELNYTVKVSPENNAVLFSFDMCDVEFDGAETVKWTVTSSQDAPYLTVDGERVITFITNHLGATGNKLTITLDDVMNEAGTYQVVIPAAGFRVDGQKTEDDLVFTYYVKNGQPTFNPAPGEVGDLSKIALTFEGVDKAVLAEGAMPTLKNAAGDAMVVNVKEEGNVITVNVESELVNGKYNLEFAANSLILDGATYPNSVKAAYTYVALPEYTLAVDPKEGVVESLSKIALTFAGVTEVKTAAAVPTIVNKADNSAAGTITTTAEGNVLTLTLSAAVEAAGEYVVTVPAGACTLDGAPVDEIVLNYEIKGSAVSEIAAGTAKVTVVTIDGKVVAKDADASSLKLDKGVYIINGKKVMK